MRKTLGCLMVLVLVCGASSTLAKSAHLPHPQMANEGQLAQTPPMGWNSWDAYGLTITEEQFRSNVDVLDKSLKASGWNYAVIDEGWFLKNPQDRSTPEKLVYVIDANGRYIPDPARFASALQDGENTGFAALGASLHARGLKFGIHIVRGIPRESVTKNLPVAGSRFHAQDVANQSDACPWDPTTWGVKDTPAGQSWYDSLVAQYAAWGVDYLKVDCISDHPFKLAEIRMIHRAIAKSHRPIVLSLSPGPTSPGVYDQIKQYAQLWRISDDVWDYWKNDQAWPRSLKDHFDLVSGWAPLAKPGAWPDADMLPIGYLGPTPGFGDARQTRLSETETQTMITLWAMMRSPLILGANLTRLDGPTLALLTNPEVIDVDQHGQNAHQESREGFTCVWRSEGRNGTSYLALFNMDDRPASVSHGLTFYNLPANSYKVRDVWKRSGLGEMNALNVTVPPHGSVLLALEPRKP